MKRRDVIACGLGAITLAAAASRPVRAATAQRIRFAYRPMVAIDLAFVRAVSLGEFQAAGFDVELVPFARSDQIGAALMNGEIEGSTGIPLEPFVTLAGKGEYPARAYLVWYFDPHVAYDGFLVPVDSPVRTLDDLRTKKIASYPSKQVDYLLSKMLPNAAIKPYDAANPLAPLASGEADAAWVLEPVISQGVVSGRYRLVEPSSIANRIFRGERVPAAVSVFSAKWLAEKPEQTEAFIRLARQKHDENRRNDVTDWKVALLGEAKFGAFPPAVASRVVEPASSGADAVTPHQFQLFQQLLKDIKVLDHPVDFQKLAYSPR